MDLSIDTLKKETVEIFVLCVQIDRQLWFTDPLSKFVGVKIIKIHTKTITRHCDLIRNSIKEKKIHQYKDNSIEINA